MFYLRHTHSAYDRAMAEFVTSVIDGFVALSPLIGGIRMQPTVHAGPIRNVPGPEPVDHPLNRFESCISIETDVIRNSRIDEFDFALHNLAKQHEHDLTQTMLSTLQDVTTATGNVINAEGKPFSFDMVNDMLEKIEIAFDDHGLPIMPTIVVSPETYEKIAHVSPTPEQMHRQREILIHKKAKYDAQKRTRRLS
jgi:hypothetical protein